MSTVSGRRRPRAGASHAGSEQRLNRRLQTFTCRATQERTDHPSVDLQMTSCVVVVEWHTSHADNRGSVHGSAVGWRATHFVVAMAGCPLC
jgi:hypothetical protein